MLMIEKLRLTRTFGYAEPQIGAKMWFDVRQLANQWATSDSTWDAVYKKVPIMLFPSSLDAAIVAEPVGLPASLIKLKAVAEKAPWILTDKGVSNAIWYPGIKAEMSKLSLDSLSDETAIAINVLAFEALRDIRTAIATVLKR